MAVALVENRVAEALASPLAFGVSDFISSAVVQLFAPCLCESLESFTEVALVSQDVVLPLSTSGSGACPGIPRTRISNLDQSNEAVANVALAGEAKTALPSSARARHAMQEVFTIL